MRKRRTPRGSGLLPLRNPPEHRGHRDELRHRRRLRARHRARWRKPRPDPGLRQIPPPLREPTVGNSGRGLVAPALANETVSHRSTTKESPGGHYQPGGCCERQATDARTPTMQMRLTAMACALPRSASSSSAYGTALVNPSPSNEASRFGNSSAWVRGPNELGRRDIALKIPAPLTEVGAQLARLAWGLPRQVTGVSKNGCTPKTRSPDNKDLTRRAGFRSVRESRGTSEESRRPDSRRACPAMRGCCCARRGSDEREPRP